MLKTEFVRDQAKTQYASLNDYLVDLKLALNIRINPPDWSPRISQLTLKTNQFNVTTLRLSEVEICQRFANPGHRSYAFETTDRFGDYGITGLASVQINGTSADIEQFLMSCRVLGRNIEAALFDFLVRDLHGLGIQTVTARYRPTAKNEQVAHLYERFGFV